MESINVAIVDDHILFAGGLSETVNHLEKYNVTIRAENGRDFIDKIKTEELTAPKIVLLDLDMPLMDGFETLNWIKSSKLNCKVLVLTEKDENQGVVRSLQLGASGYLLKNVAPSTLKEAMDTIIKNGFYHNDLICNALLNGMNLTKNNIVDEIKVNELAFLKLACTDRTYKEIAMEMNLSHKTIDGYRKNLFDKLNVKSRVGLVLFAMQNKLIE